MQCDR
ncbi:e0ba9c17-9c53-45c8-a077-e40b71d7a742 [Thermothielavioides terrestris]